MTSVIIDPGHGGVDEHGFYQTPGKRYVFSDGTTIYEGQRMRVLAVFLAAELTRLGIDCYSSLDGELITPSWDPEASDVALSTRVRNANVIMGQTLYVSLHSNAIESSSNGHGQTRANGVCIFTSKGNTKSDVAATRIWEALEASTGLLRMRSQSYEDGDPDYEAGFYVLRKTHGPAVLIELGFHDNPSDAAWLLDDSNLLLAAISIAAGIMSWIK